MKTLDQLFHHMLKDVYYAEKQILKALPKMAKKASSDDLREAFQHHLEETKGQVDRLEQVFAIIDRKPAGETCEAIKGLIDEGEEIMSESDTEEVLDAGLLAAAQAVEHYEIARYGTLVSWAKQLGHDDAAKLLQETLDQEHNADDTLNGLAENRLNKKAA